MHRIATALLMGAISTTATAESIGLRSTSLSFGMTRTDNADPQITAALAILDVAITGHHGFQGGLTFEDTPSGGIGALNAHLYLAPAPDHKLGLFATISDVDGRAMRWATIGAEAMASIGPETILEGRAGIGYGDEGLDFIFAGAALSHNIGPDLQIEAFVDTAHFDEPQFEAISYDIGLIASFRPNESPVGGYLGVTRSGMTDLYAETRLSLGLTIDIGQTGSASPQTRTFRTPDPAAAVIRHELW